MSWMDQIGGLLGQLGGGQLSPEHAEQHFDQVAQNVPSGDLASGLAAAFRSDATPAFGQLAAQLFGNSNPQQKAGLLNTLLAAAGPALLSGGAGSLLSQFTGGGQQPITPEQAEQISPDVVHDLAAHAQTHDPSIIDQVSGFYSEHPTLVKTLGGLVLSVALAKLANRNA